MSCCLLASCYFSTSTSSSYFVLSYKVFCKCSSVLWMNETENWELTYYALVCVKRILSKKKSQYCSVFSQWTKTRTETRQEEIIGRSRRHLRLYVPNIKAESHFRLPPNSSSVGIKFLSINKQQNKKEEEVEFVWVEL